MISGNPKIPTSSTTALPDMPSHEKLPALKQQSIPEGSGVPQSYKDSAHSGANVMFRARVKGQKTLSDDIPLHVSLKTFDKPGEVPIDEIHQKVKELGIQRPNSKKIQVKPEIFTSPRTGKSYYMLKLHNTDPSYAKFNQHFKGRGITHENAPGGFMGHITVNKDIFDKVKNEGIKPEELEFSPLMIEHGANNPTHLFPDNESHKDATDEITPKKLNPMAIKKAEEFLSKPYVSEAQRRWAHTESGKEALGGEAGVHEWDEATKGKKLPEKVGKLEKGALRHLATGAAIVGALSGAPHMAQAPNQPKQQVQPGAYSSDKMLNAISQVESSGGKNTNHAMLHDKTNSGERAYGKFGITPSIIRETISMDPNLKRDHAKAMNLHGQDMEHYMQDNPNLEQSVAVRHLNRLEHHFGKDPGKIGLAWIDGISGAHKKLKQGLDPRKHWHASKVIHAYGKGK